jgi:hypothetical protein
MANANFAFGLKPVRRFSGATYNCAARRYSARPPMPPRSSSATPSSRPARPTPTAIPRSTPPPTAAPSPAWWSASKTSPRCCWATAPPPLPGRSWWPTIPSCCSRSRKTPWAARSPSPSVGLNCDLISAAGSTSTRTSGWMLDTSTGRHHGDPAGQDRRVPAPRRQHAGQRPIEGAGQDQQAH